HYDFHGDIHYPVISDLSSDGNPALLVVDDSNNAVQLFVGSGTGTFVQGPTYQANGGSQALAVDDFNGDGKPDLAVVNQGSFGASGSVMVNLGTGWPNVTGGPAATPTAIATATPILGNGYYEIKNRKSGKVLDVQAGLLLDNTRIIQFTDNHSDNQQWNL